MKKGFFYFVLSKICATFALDLRNREVAQLVSVRVWGARGRQFESGLPDQKSRNGKRHSCFFLSIYIFIRFSISLFMHALDGTSAGVVHVLEGGIPFEGDSR